ncbi:nucleotidyltransferase domain-containing protein [Azohydromonas aeria]|uniref:nucleotidyltransferase domain-containing protein n=1 Tax=Azohydromonas aeria TaxID=2590212 RepID=UPI0012F939AC|nr:nucleotidyltransferase domain-containing protein [Azohydromonas aeria]
MPKQSQAQSHLRYPLTSLLGSAGSVRMLRALVADRAPQSVPQLARQAGLSPRGARQVLDGLVGQRLVQAHGIGRAQVYLLNESHPFAHPIAALFREEAQRWERLLATVRDVLSVRGAGVEAAWLYGSVARGEDTPQSDLDIALLVASREVTDQVREALMPVEDEHHVHVSLTGLTAEELAGLPEDDPWWRDVMRDGRVLKGSAPGAARQRLMRAAA